MSINCKFAIFEFEFWGVPYKKTQLHPNEHVEDSFIKRHAYILYTYT